MQALVLDFDGVISDSARESFAVSLRTYRRLQPDSRLGENETEALYARFVELMPLGNRAEDYGTTLAALEAEHPLRDQDDYDRFKAGLDAQWLDRYHAAFYEERAALAEQDRRAWLDLMAPYPGLLELLRRHAGEIPYAIATSKDRASVTALLGAWGAADLFPGDRILDKEAGPRKTAHLQVLRRRFALDFPEMTFVDDKVNHLEAVAPLGVRCVLAAWGYNAERERQQARTLGYTVRSLDDFEQLWGAD